MIEELRSRKPARPAVNWNAILGLIKQMADHSETSSQSSSDHEAGAPASETAAARPNRGRARRRNKERKAKDYDENPRVAIEAAESHAKSNPQGASIFQLNTTSITVVVEAMMGAFLAHIFQLQEIKKDHKAIAALLKRLRFKGFQASASPSIIKNEGLSAGVLTAARKHVSVQLLPGKEQDGITADPQCIWRRLMLNRLDVHDPTCKCLLPVWRWGQRPQRQRPPQHIGSHRWRPKVRHSVG